ncbi:MAG: hypothetical protein IPP57_26950 [Candidatus Obscuribacter sp.]|jgi:hypothetical protein|nr:hypothetical protein [Candidatus Obscuribacter sp.]MDQ5965805.1 hypothetical protein [Cyanobacteriota bacterium erpe_2018_sw_39hr_WHONDRS-SW48-000098_B_bin.30]MBK7841399.1 hypothetical protein [Candidatus Obscuribacter sp.]MBK9204627.1 hypothetical protein [Candidatus Obscuribacter sp.]MBK9622246.1 hypothetical protein [Candidatus Obscuribacter sp.]
MARYPLKAQNPYEGFFERSATDGGLDRLAAQNFKPGDVNCLGQIRDPKALAGELPNLAFLSVKDAAKQINELKHDPRFSMLSGEQIRQMMASEAMANRDKFSFVSAAICGPFFLFGIGAAFALFDDIKGAREAKLQKMLTGKTDATTGAQQVIPGETVEQRKKRLEGDKRPLKQLTPEAAKMLGLDVKTGAPSRMDAAIKEEIQKKLDARTKKLEGKTPVRESDARLDVTERLKQRLVNESGRAWEATSAQMSLKTWMKAQVLLKSKQSLLNRMEQSRGKEQYSAYSGMAAKLEVLDKALKRMGL